MANAIEKELLAKAKKVIEITQKQIDKEEQRDDKVSKATRLSEEQNKERQTTKRI